MSEKKAYSIVSITVHDREKFSRYVEGHLPTIEKFGGKFLVKGVLGEVLEGSFPSHFMVMHEFPSISRFKEWYYSEEYRPWKTLRQEAADANVILVEGT